MRFNPDAYVAFVEKVAALQVQTPATNPGFLSHMINALIKDAREIKLSAEQGAYNDE